MVTRAENWVVITVESIGQTPKGRATIKAVGNKNGLLVGNDAGKLPNLGQTIEADISESVYDGKTNYWLNAWRQTDAAPVVAGNGHGATPDAHLRFISNVVGQAILAKTVTKPEEILSWAQAAQGALSALES